MNYAIRKLSFIHTRYTYLAGQEEQRRLLGGGAVEGEDSEEELFVASQPAVITTQETIHDPPPSYNPPTSTPNPVQAVSSNIDTAPEIIMLPPSRNLMPMAEPPKYSMYAPPTHLVAQSAGYPVQVQMDGRVVPAMLVQDVSMLVVTDTPFCSILATKIWAKEIKLFLHLCFRITYSDYFSSFLLLVIGNYTYIACRFIVTLFIPS